MRPFRVDVRLTPSDEVLKLREQVEQLQTELDGLRTDYLNLEFKYRQETIINMELQDLLREHGISFRPIIAQRHTLG